MTRDQDPGSKAPPPELADPFRGDLLAGKTCVVTGGGSGLGRSIALRVGRLGAAVGLVGRRPEPLEETARELAAAGARAATAPCDVRDAAAVQGAFAALEQALGPVDQLVNAAAGNFLCPSEDLTPNGFDAVVRTVLHGTFHCTQAFARALIARGAPGQVVSIVTNYAERGSPFVLPSAVAKAGVLAMTRSLAVEWAAYGIRLNAVAPGPFPTEGAWSRLFPTPEVEREALARIPAGRFGAHSELTNLVAYLLSGASPYQTGDLVTIDGGEALMSGQEFAGMIRYDRATAKAFMAAMRPPKSRG
jgi:NAD(P)-dependent dehydrogenase (short-subunit alcohol dehydrogenase family)